MERYQPQPPKETRMFRNVPMQAIADVLRSLPIPITITQMLDEQKESVFYRYQVGVTTPDNPVGICMGSARQFLDAVKFSLQMVMSQREDGSGDTGRLTNTGAKYRATSPTDEWIVPEVERGEASTGQAATLGLPYRHRGTGETIAQWTERTRNDHPDAISQAGNMGEQEEGLIHVLRNLPIAVNIWKRDDGYIWQCYEQSGISDDFAGGVREGLHVLFGQLTRDQESRRGTYRAFGNILYQTQTEDGSYTERIVTDTAGGRVVMCALNGVTKLFRVEWTEPDGYQPHKAVYTLRDAMDLFQSVVPPSQQERP